MQMLTLVAFGILAISESFKFSRAAASPPAELFSTLVAQKISATASNFSSPAVYPGYTDSSGKWQYFETDTWTTGFFPSLLYALHTRSTLCASSQSSDQTLFETDWLGLARSWSASIVSLESNNILGHDVGFVSFPFQDELSLDSSNETAKDVVNAFAADLAARFDPIVGCTRSWDTSDPTDFTVIIDNMMNLDILFISANLTGNDSLRNMATSHADKTLQNHIRSDGSSFHVVEYNETTGTVIRQRTSQGYADNSTWTRGQAWGIYGFAQMFQNTGNETYLDTSRRMATYFATNLPEDGIVPWDFNAPDTGTRPADSSAAMIAANALVVLSGLESSLGNSSGSILWMDQAYELLSNHTSSFWQPDWESLLSNGTVSNTDSPPNNNTGIVYGDYYFVKAGNSLLSSGIVNCSGAFNSSAATASSSNTTSSGSNSASPRTLSSSLAYSRYNFPLLIASLALIVF